MLLEDSNLPKINWVDVHFPKDNKSQVILNFSNELGLTQLICNQLEYKMFWIYFF